MFGSFRSTITTPIS